MSNYPCPLSHFPRSHFVSDDNTCDGCELPIASEVYTVNREQLCEACHDEALLKELSELIEEENTEACDQIVTGNGDLIQSFHFEQKEALNATHHLLNRFCAVHLDGRGSAGKLDIVRFAHQRASATA